VINDLHVEKETSSSSSISAGARPIWSSVRRKLRAEIAAAVVGINKILLDLFANSMLNQGQLGHSVQSARRIILDREIEQQLHTSKI
jgi:riboflavin biosynthesis pyrimidine reductase